MLAIQTYPFSYLDSFFDNSEICNITEDGKYIRSYEVPGLKAEDIKIEIKKGVISIKGERKLKNSHKSYTTHFTVSPKFNADTLVAELENGILTIMIDPHTKINDVVSKKIEVINKN